MSSNAFLKTFIKYFPLPKALAFDFVGVDIGKNSIKVMKLEDSKFGKIPSKFREYKILETCAILDYEEGGKECNEILGVLKSIKKEFDVDYVNVSIPEVKTYIYKTKVPSSVGKNISKTLLFSVEENVPIKPEEVLIDYFVLGVENDEVEVIVTAVQKEIIEKYTQIFESVGLNPISFEPETHAITRGIIKKGDKNQYLLLNLDSNLSSIAVIEDEVVQYTQILPISSKDFSQEFSEEDAKILKENINKVIIYWGTSISQSKKEDLQTLFLVGEFSSSFQLMHYLEKNISLNIKFASVWNNCFNLDEYIPKLHSRDSLKYAIAIGLALKRIK